MMCWSKSDWDVESELPGFRIVVYRTVLSWIYDIMRVKDRVCGRVYRMIKAV